MIEMRGYGRTQAIRYVQIDRYIDVERERETETIPKTFGGRDTESCNCFKKIWMAD